MEQKQAVDKRDIQDVDKTDIQDVDNIDYIHHMENTHHDTLIVIVAKEKNE